MDIVCRARVYDRSYGVEPETMVAEPGVMGVSHRGYGVGARGYDRSYGVEPGYGVRARVYDRSCGWSQSLWFKSQTL